MLRHESGKKVGLSRRARAGLALAGGVLAVGTGCSSSSVESNPVPTAVAPVAADQGGAGTSEQKETQANIITFADHEQLFAENGDKVTFDAITEAIALSDQGDVTGSAKTLESIGFNQDIVKNALTLSGDTADDTGFLEYYAKDIGKPWSSAENITDALKPEVILALPAQESDNKTPLTSETLIVFFNFIPKDQINSKTQYIIDQTYRIKTDVPSDDSYTEEEKDAMIRYANNLFAAAQEVRLKEGLPEYQSPSIS